MRKIVIVFLLCLSAKANAQIVLSQGDIIFQNLDCGPLCDAIEKVTFGYHGAKFSHIGLVYQSPVNDSLYIIEAIGSKVQLTPIKAFIERDKGYFSNNRTAIAQPKKAYKSMAYAAAKFAALSYIDIPYDDPFLYNNGKYYCSEMIFDAFNAIDSLKNPFELQPMTFKDPDTKGFFPAWVAYYKNLNIAIPEGAPGINPGGMSQTKAYKVRFLNSSDIRMKIK